MLNCEKALQNESANIKVQHHMKFAVPLKVCFSLMLHSTGCDKDIDPGEEGGERPLPQQLHFHIYQEVSGLADLSLQVDGSRETVQLPGAEETLLIALDDADDDVIAGKGGRWSNSEDLGGDDDVGLEAEVVVCDTNGGVLTV